MALRQLQARHNIRDQELASRDAERVGERADRRFVGAALATLESAKGLQRNAHPFGRFTLAQR